MSSVIPGTRIRRNGRDYEWILPGWWQPVLTEKEKSAIARGETPLEWKPTEDDKRRAREYAEKLICRRKVGAA